MEAKSDDADGFGATIKIGAQSTTLLAVDDPSVELLFVTISSKSKTSFRTSFYSDPLLNALVKELGPINTQGEQFPFIVPFVVTNYTYVATSGTSSKDKAAAGDLSKERLILTVTPCGAGALDTALTSCELVMTALRQCWERSMPPSSDISISALHSLLVQHVNTLCQLAAITHAQHLFPTEWKERISRILASAFALLFAARTSAPSGTGPSMSGPLSYASSMTLGSIFSSGPPAFTLTGSAAAAGSSSSSSESSGELDWRLITSAVTALCTEASLVYNAELNLHQTSGPGPSRFDLKRVLFSPYVQALFEAVVCILRYERVANDVIPPSSLGLPLAAAPAAAASPSPLISPDVKARDPLLLSPVPANPFAALSASAGSTLLPVSTTPTCHQLVHQHLPLALHVDQLTAAVLDPTAPSSSPDESKTPAGSPRPEPKHANLTFSVKNCECLFCTGAPGKVVLARQLIDVAAVPKSTLLDASAWRKVYKPEAPRAGGGSVVPGGDMSPVPSPRRAAAFVAAAHLSSPSLTSLPGASAAGASSSFAPLAGLPPPMLARGRSASPAPAASVPQIGSLLLGGLRPSSPSLDMCTPGPPRALESIALANTVRAVAGGVVVEQLPVAVRDTKWSRSHRMGVFDHILNATATPGQEQRLPEVVLNRHRESSNAAAAPDGGEAGHPVPAHASRARSDQDHDQDAQPADEEDDAADGGRPVASRVSSQLAAGGAAGGASSDQGSVAPEKVFAQSLFGQFCNTAMNMSPSSLRSEVGAVTFKVTFSGMRN